jgi:mono/diheme cytochrome c family protein
VGRRAAVTVLALAVAGLATATALTWDGGGAPAAPPASATAPAALDGAALFQAKGCAVCHMAPGREEGYAIGPDLRGLAASGSRVPGRSAREYARESILSPAAFVVAGFGAMPRLAVSPAEADALAAYLVPGGR